MLQHLQIEHLVNEYNTSSHPQSLEQVSQVYMTDWTLLQPFTC